MPYDQLSENARLIIAEIQDIIIRKPTKGNSKPRGWEYSNQELSAAVARLENELNQVDFEVIETHVFHIIYAGNIYNLISHLFLIPLNGSPRFDKDNEPLRESHYTRESGKISGPDIDIICVALKEK
ncbi:hypothetical protein BDV32DRAFT_131845 [Aspergillus pseudonomiae]|nr:hypothetical protein BDV32DRAFT_131845 [Aspergillus pseudonomiae]